MVVLEQDHIEKSDTMVHSATYLHSFLFEHTHTWGSLAGIEHASLQAFQLSHILGSDSGNTTHALHDIQHSTLGLEQRLYTAFYHKGDISRLHMCTIVDKYGWLQLRVEFLKHLHGDIHACEDSFFFHNKLRFAHFIGRNAAKGGAIAVAYILSKCQVEQFID